MCFPSLEKSSEAIVGGCTYAGGWLVENLGPVETESLTAPASIQRVSRSNSISDNGFPVLGISALPSTNFTSWIKWLSDDFPGTIAALPVSPPASNVAKSVIK